MKDFINNLQAILGIMNNKENRELIETIRKFTRIFAPHPLFRLLYDLLLFGGIIIAIILCGKGEMIDKPTMQSLLTITIGAFVGARFKD